jgi:tetratricopeptide (TPR) repeat protein
MLLTLEDLSFRFQETLNKSKVGLLCGAGISIASGIPDAINITKIILQELGCTKPDMEAFYNVDNVKKYLPELPAAFEAIISTVNDKIEFENDTILFIDIFAQNFEATYTLGHFFWAKCLKEHKLKFIATTNFDTCLEQALNIEPLSKNIIYPYSDDSLTIREADITNKLIKLHGCMSSPRSLGTTIQQISKFTSVNNINTIVDRIFKNDHHDTLLVVGYSCSDAMDIIPQIQNIGISAEKGQKVKIIYWSYTKSASFTWHFLSQSPPFPELDKIKVAFKNFPEVIIIRGDLDLFISFSAGVPIPNRIPAKFSLKNKVANPNITLGSIFLTGGYYAHAIKYMMQELPLELKGVDNKKEINVLCDIGKAFNVSGNFNAALKYHKRALRMVKSDRHSSREEFAKINVLLGEDYWDKGDTETAIACYENAISLYSDDFEKNEASIAEVYNNLGDAYVRYRHFNKAIDYCQKSIEIRLKLFGEINNEVSNSYNNIGFAYSFSHDYIKALYYHKKALSIRQAIFGIRHDWVAQSQINIGAAYYKKGNYRSSIKYYKRALKIYQERVSKDYHMLAVVYTNIGHAHLKIGLFPQSLYFYSQAEKIWITNFGRKYFYLALLYAGMGKTYRELKEYKQSLKYFERGLRVAKPFVSKMDVQYEDLLKNKNEVENILSTST